MENTRKDGLVYVLAILAPIAVIAGGHLMTGAVPNVGGLAREALGGFWLIALMLMAGYAIKGKASGWTARKFLSLVFLVPAWSGVALAFLGLMSI